jgi:serine/threonine protein kinase
VTAPSNADELVQLVRQSGLARPAALPAHPAGRAEELAGELVRTGVLTAFQARQLLQGRWKGFFPGAGRYRLLELLGGGGTGWVYLAEEGGTRRPVALKMVAGQAQEPARLASFWREAAALVQVDHPNVVQLRDLDASGGSPFLVQEYIDGTDLNALVARGGPVALARAAGWIVAAAAGLAHLHQRGLIHADVKPANLAVNREGVVKVLDLGSSGCVGQSGEAGTPGYLSPEQAQGLPLDGRTDVYGLGATLAFLLTGRPGLEGAGHLPGRILLLLERMLERDPGRRPSLAVVTTMLELLASPSAPRPEELPELCPALRWLLGHGWHGPPVPVGDCPSFLPQHPF